MGKAMASPPFMPNQAGSDRVIMSSASSSSLVSQLRALKLEHHDLDRIIEHMTDDPTVDQLLLRRLKKRRLLLKDQIKRLESALIPNLDA